jgi:protein-disulfide isomerase
MQVLTSLSQHRTASALLCVLLGYALGVASPYLPRQQAAAARPSEVVVVVQTATPGPLAPSEPPAQSTVVANATVSQTLAGARDGLRIGTADAQVQIVLFSDPHCPFCRKLAVESVNRVISEHVASGVAAITYRHYPFLGPESQTMAIAMECAARQGKFWRFHDLVFGDASGAVDSWAAQAALDRGAFDVCQRDDGVRNAIEADLELGRTLGVRGTPTLFVNGRPLVGAVPYSFLQSAIEEALRDGRRGS